MASMGVTVVNYHSNNGIFTSSQSQDELAEMGQDLTLSGVGAHHQNVVVERAIGMVVSMTRMITLHAKMWWPSGISTKLWPMAMKHAQHLLNHLPADNNVCPLDLVLKTSVSQSALRNLHVWGAPCFEPQTRMTLHLCLLPKHASTVPLVLIPSTGNIPLSSMSYLMTGLPLSIPEKSPLMTQSTAPSGLTCS